MKLYYSPGACSLASHIVLEWIGEPYEAVPVSREQRKTPEYLQINPAGAVPAFEHDSWVLTQNAAILNYLADRFPEAGLCGDGTPKSRAEVNRWLGFVNSDVHPAFRPLFGATAYLGDDASIEKSKDHARSTLRGLFERADGQLAGHEWIAGPRSIADTYLYVVTRWTQAVGVALSGLAHLDRHFAAMQADPGVQRALKQEGLA
ncbi:glutathione S-transferase family protein [Cognatiluteimonas weifangensis]|uniref:Glutathione S-transferase family protein n=1 Tax=Cognatiluteimonas weifangensis TaxID=2303539 RepID=A0A372DH91_9GAMM|nr:glutathione S-transferase N-terminal domain-containing protein [Luteimonas weifangensis]RFP58051.1 glutathione S-transferase family protein [Luteimonas weifangensis]